MTGWNALENNRHARRARACVQSSNMRKLTRLYLSGRWVPVLGESIRKFVAPRGPCGVAPTKTPRQSRGVPWLFGSSTEDVIRYEVLGHMAITGDDEKTAEGVVAKQREARAAARLRKTPTHIVHRWAPDPDQPGKVAPGTARDMKNAAEAHHIGGFREQIAALTWMGAPAEETPEESRKRRNAARRTRKARR